MTGLSTTQYSPEGFCRVNELIDLISQTMEKFSRCILIWDIMVDLSENDPLCAFLIKTKITKFLKERKLTIFVLKSLQKYAKLDSYSIRVGFLGFVGSQEESQDLQRFWKEQRYDEIKEQWRPGVDYLCWFCVLIKSLNFLKLL